MSNIFKFNNISIIHDDKYVIEKTNDIDHDFDKTKLSQRQIDLESVKIQANNVIREGEKEAKKIIDKAKQEVASIKENAYNEGYSQGIKEGYKQGYNESIEKINQKLNAELKKIDELRKEMYREKALLLKQSEKELLELSIKIAEKILHIELEDDNKYIEFVKGIMSNIAGKTVIQIRVNEKDFEKILKNKDYLLSSIEGLEDIKIIKDKYLTQGSCIVDGGIGILDGSVDTQLKQIEENFLTIIDSNINNEGENYV